MGRRCCERVKSGAGARALEFSAAARGGGGSTWTDSTDSRADRQTDQPTTAVSSHPPARLLAAGATEPTLGQSTDVHRSSRSTPRLIVDACSRRRWEPHGNMDRLAVERPSPSMTLLFAFVLVTTTTTTTMTAVGGAQMQPARTARKFIASLTD